MGYFTLFYLFLYLIIEACEVSTSTKRTEDKEPVRTFRRHASPPLLLDWELGLREAVHQALLREHYTEPTIREQLLVAPFLGRQNKASPFGDIAVLARGQLYVTSDGFKFVQDADEEDCSDCHNPRCLGASECLWHTLGHHQKLLALWTVKRIRHRDPQYGHVFEVEYTISPITSAVTEDLVKRHGYFNYNIPGHIFVIRTNPRLNSVYYLNGNVEKLKDQVDQNRDYKETANHFKPGILIGVTPDGYKQVLHSLPGFFSSYHPQTQYNDHTTIDPKEYELYKKLIESLASKTSHVPHRFSVTTPVADTTTTPTYHLTTAYVPVPQTTYVQFSDGQIVPLTENVLQPTTVGTTTPLKPQNTRVTKYSEADLFYHTVPSTTPKPYTVPLTKIPTQVTKFSEPELFYQTVPSTTVQPITVPLTTLHYYTPVHETSTTTRKSGTTTKSRKITSLQNIDDFDIFPTVPSRKTTKYTVLPLQTTQGVTTHTDDFDLFPVTSTEPMKPVTEIPRSTYFVTEQLPPPDRNIDTTVPYTTVTQPSIVTTEKVSKAIKTTPKFTPRDEATTIEKVPYTEERTTVILPTTQEQRTTTPIGRTTEEKRTTAYFSPTISPYSTTVKQTTTSNRGTTSEFTAVPSTHVIPNTERTTFYTKPTTLFEYNFDSTIKDYTEPLSSTKYPTGETTQFTIPTTQFSSTEPTGFTLPSTNTKFPSKEPTRFTIPTTTTHYYYTFESSESTTDGTLSTQSKQPETTTIKLMTEPTETTHRTPKLTTTKKANPTKATSTTLDDFLIDPDIGKKVNKILDTKKDFDEDDIFGKASTKPTRKSTEGTTKKTVQSDIDKALFGGQRSKPLKHSARVTKRPLSDTTKIIYDNFYTPTRSPAVDLKPSTDQSYSTSISFQVNKRNDTKSSTVYHLEPTIKAELTEVGGHNASYKVYKAELPLQVTTTEKSKSETKKAFDEVALQLVNHARSIDYLQSKPSRQSKYRRRSSSTRRKLARRVHTKDNKTASA